MCYADGLIAPAGCSGGALRTWVPWLAHIVRDAAVPAAALLGAARHCSVGLVVLAAPGNGKISRLGLELIASLWLWQDESRGSRAPESGARYGEQCRWT